LARIPASAKIEAAVAAKKKRIEISNTIKKGCLKLAQAAFFVFVSVKIT
jgi:hypothetical protein